jgi:hypothetical protein
MARSICVVILLLTPMAFVRAPLAYGQSRPTPLQSENVGQLSPEKIKSLNEMLDRTIDEYIPWLTQMYELTPDQQKQIRQRLEALKEEHIQYGPKASAEMISLQQELRFYIEKARKGEPIDKEMVKDLQSRLAGVMENAPFNFNNVIVQSEKFMSDEQIQAGRQRQAEYKERMAEAAGRQPRMPPTIPREYEALKPYLDLESPQGSSAGLPPPQPREPSKGPAASGPAGPVVVEFVPLDAWGRYVEDFITKYQLDSKQAQQARLILGELRKRADEYRMARKADYAAAEQIKETQARNEEIARLDSEIHKMFVELKSRLDAIPTEAQRKLAEATAASQPAKAPASRPAVPGKGPASVPASGPASAPASAPARGAAGPG